MVWSLFYSSLVSIANGIKDGRIQNPHMLPPNLRQRVLDTVLQRRLINNPNSMALLSSVRFLNGMKSLSTEHGGYEMEFLERLKTSMATVIPNGVTVGDAITKLNLSVYECEEWRGSPSHIVKSSTYPMVARLIAQCPNTTSLALCGIQSKLASTGQNISALYPTVLNKDDVCNSVVENLIDLSLRDLGKVLSSEWPMIKFKRLTTLKLDDCSLQFDIWPEFLRNNPTLQNLHLIDVKGVGKGDDSIHSSNHLDAYGLDWILHIPMPHLQSLEIVSPERLVIFECNKAFVDNLMGCPKLHRVYLSLDQNSTEEESLVRLASMNIDLNVKVRFCDWYPGFSARQKYKIDAALDSSSKFKIVRIFHERIDRFELLVWRKWIPEYTTALQDAIDSCPNLTTLGVLLRSKYHPISTDMEPVDLERINASLLQFFGTRDRAMLLKDLSLRGNIGEDVIIAAFNCCLNLDRLDIDSITAVRDQHLIDLVSNGGGKLKHLKVSYCQSVTSEGIIPILEKSSEGLLSIHVNPCRGRNWMMMLNSLCPYAKIW